MRCCLLALLALLSRRPLTDPTRDAASSALAGPLLDGLWTC
jgi:hypothetical protein